jgi:hypothetical protein
MWNKNIETMEQNITTKRTKLAKEQIGSNHGTKLWSGKKRNCGTKKLDHKTNHDYKYETKDSNHITNHDVEENKNINLIEQISNSWYKI